MSLSKWLLDMIADNNAAEYECGFRDEESVKYHDKVSASILELRCQQKRLEQLQTENKKMRDALNFYADFPNWDDLADETFSQVSNQCIINGSDVEDFIGRSGKNYPCGGKRARQALEAQNKKYREALEFYSRNGSWLANLTNEGFKEYSEIDILDLEKRDDGKYIGGKRAREALKED